MKLKLGDVQTTALIPLAVKANETLRKNPRKLIIFLVTENLHSCMIVKGNALLNRIPADTVCTGIYIWYTVFV